MIFQVTICPNNVSHSDILNITNFRPLIRLGSGMARLGYARVSLADQSTDLQIRELEAAGCDRIYRDQGISGTRVSRPELDRMLDRLGRGDEVVVWKLDRLGRNTRHLLELLDDFKSRGIKFRSLRDGIVTEPDSEVGGAIAQAMVTIISAFAQLERDQLSERTRAGMAAAAENGRKAGRREVTADHDKVKRTRELKARGLKPADIGKIIGASRATVYRYLSMES
ncbi:recombinase family protein [Arthrobacter sp. MA-N2]|uniref:recombinase family protein n=1 Tax=Arthrobacter sp. MA-N2 TaxID=1101188 RepID=UPI001E497159|nr:recombinase family protein [Arthrobacter sp. MA-N2]